MSVNNTVLLNRVFTRNTFKDLLEKHQDSAYIMAVKGYIVNPENKKNIELLSEIYNELKSNYRNEYFYKNTLLNKLLLGVHSVTTTTALTEVPIAKSKADFILINGKAIVYEIKTELDNFERLETQIDDYYKAFNHVTVVTCESNYNVLNKRLNETPVGISILRKNGSLSVRKKPDEYNICLDLNVIFKILRKSEYEVILKEFYGELPQVSQFKYYSKCRELFCKIDVNLAYALFLKQLKKRNKINIELYKKVPYELKFLTYFMNFKGDDYLKLDNFLNNKLGG